MDINWVLQSVLPKIFWASQDFSASFAYHKITNSLCTSLFTVIYLKSSLINTLVVFIVVYTTDFFFVCFYKSLKRFYRGKLS